MKTTTLTLTNGNTIELVMLGTSSPTGTLTVTDRDGNAVARWEGDLPHGISTALEASSFRLVRRCEGCGAAFRAKRATAKTCSTRCRTLVWRSRRAS